MIREAVAKWLLRNIENPRRAITAKDLEGLIEEPTFTGVSVTPSKALQISAVFACIRLIAENIGTLPVHIFRGVGKTRERLEFHKLQEILTERPNDEIDAGELYRFIAVSMLSQGNGYIYLERDEGARIIGLWPIPADKVTILRAKESGRLGYKVTLDPQSDKIGRFFGLNEVLFDADDVKHYRAFGTSPIIGLSPIKQTKQLLGEALATQEYGARFFANNAFPGGVIEVEKPISDDAFNKLRSQWSKLHQGVKRAHLTGILSGGAKWKSISINPEEAQFLELRKFHISDIARIFGVPPHMIGDVEKSTSWGAGIEQQSIGFVQYTLRPWLTRIEKVTSTLLEEDEYIKFSVEGLLRGDIRTRHQSYAVGRQWGWYSRNDIRRLEDMDEIEGGDDYLIPLNMVPVGSSGSQEEPKPEEKSKRTLETRQFKRVRKTFHIANVKKIIKKFFEKQHDEVAGSLKRAIVLSQREKWDRELEEKLFLAGKLAATDFYLQVADHFDGGVNLEAMDAFLRNNSKIAAKKINDKTEAGIIKTLTKDDPKKELDDLFKFFGETRASQIALTRTTGAMNFGMHEGANASEVKTKRWLVTSLHPRPSHARLHGQAVAIDEVFSNGGKWPGDPSLPPAETARCSCELEFIKGGE